MTTEGDKAIRLTVEEIRERRQDTSFPPGRLWTDGEIDTLLDALDASEAARAALRKAFEEIERVLGPDPSRAEYGEVAIEMDNEHALEIARAALAKDKKLGG